MYWSFIILIQNTRKEETTNNSLWIINSPSDDFIPTSYSFTYSFIMFPERQKRFWDVVLFSFHPLEREQKEENKVLNCSPPREHWRGLPVVPPGTSSILLRPLQGALSVPKDSAASPLLGITRASGRKLHSIIKGVFVAYPLVLLRVHVCVRVCTLQHKDTFGKRVKLLVATCNPNVDDNLPTTCFNYCP